ncbi:MAG: DUF951 domain-containing protein [Armatimonadota bacterium]
MKPERLRQGNIVELKKKHPCGGTRWEIIRGGVDVKARCITCGRIVAMPRKKFTRSIKRIIDDEPES